MDLDDKNQAHLGGRYLWVWVQLDTDPNKNLLIFHNTTEIMIPSALCYCPSGWLLQIWCAWIMVKQLWVVQSDTGLSDLTLD